MEVIDKVALLYLNGKKILSSRSKGKDTYYLPGGKREGNETDIETLIREIKEELSVDIIPETAELYGIFEASFKLVGGTSKGHPDDKDIANAIEFYKGLIR